MHHLSIKKITLFKELKYSSQETNFFFLKGKNLLVMNIVAEILNPLMHNVLKCSDTF